MKVYLFGWPGTLGGATTKFTHLLRLLHRHYDLTVVPSPATRVRADRWVRWLRELNVRICPLADLPPKLRGWGLCFCDAGFLGTPEWADLRRRGLKMAWGNEMMWLLAGEAGALTLGEIDAVLYVSPVQRAVLEPEYRRILRGSLRSEPVAPLRKGTAGWIESEDGETRLRWVMVGNYIDPSTFPFVERSRDPKRPLVVGRLSRPDPYKFPVDFPQSYEGLGLRRVRFRVMGWSAELQQCWPGHAFDDRWDLLPPAPDPVPFLQSLDLFVYEVGPRFRESWGRAVVEAMLTGAIPLVQKGAEHHLENLVEHGRSGFVCRDRADYGRFARELERSPEKRARMSRDARTMAVRRLCNARQHLQMWSRVFHGC